MPNRGRRAKYVIVALLLAASTPALAVAEKIVVEESDTLEMRVEIPDVKVPVPPVPPHPEEVRVEILGLEGDSMPRVTIHSRRGRVHSGDEAAIVRMGEDIVVKAGEVIDGDVVAIGGKITVYGRVIGDAVAIGGRVRVDDDGFIEGDAVAIGGTVDAPAGNRIGGQTIGMRFLPAFIGLGAPGFSTGPLFGLLFYVMMAFFTFLVGWLLLAIAGGRVAAMGEYVQENLWKCLLTGLAILILTPAAFLLLLVTVLGIPLALLMPLAVPLAYLIGFLVVAVLVGLRVVRGGDTERGPGVNALAVGILIFIGAALVGQLLRLAGGPLGFLGAVLVVFGWAAGFIASSIGVGALVLSRFGRTQQPPVPGRPPDAVAPGGSIPAPSAQT